MSKKNGKQSRRSKNKDKKKKETVKTKPRAEQSIDYKLVPFDLNRMAEICKAPERFFDELPERYNLPKPFVADCGKDGNYWFFDNNAPVLAVAHLDSVDKLNHFGTVEFSGERRVYSPNLDDRLGAYIILDLLNNKYGLKYDILLTTGEESGNSTALNFATQKKYNWIFEFDRTGTDAVMYDFEDTDTAILVEDYGWDVGIGSFTDIVYLEDLGCKAFNFGTGYHDYHSRYAYADLGQTAFSVKNFLKFFKELHHTHLPHVKAPVKKYSGTLYGKFANYTYSEHAEWERGNQFWGNTDNTPTDALNDLAVGVGGADERIHLLTPGEKRYAEKWDGMACTNCDTRNPSDAHLQRYGVCSGCAALLADESLCKDPNCVRPYCKGYIVCDVCAATFHGNRELEKTGVCSYCTDASGDNCVVCDLYTYNQEPISGELFHVCSNCAERMKTNG